MINKLISGIAAALGSEFGEGYQIHTENMEQSVPKPCFFITCVSPKRELYRDRRYYLRNLFMVQYFPNGPAYRNQCMAVLERLYQALESVEIDGRPIYGTGMEGEYADQALQFKVNYNTFADKAESGDSMETLEQQIEVKG